MAQRIDKALETIVQQYAELLQTVYSIHSIYLYGSRSAGLSNEDSDIDVAVVSEDFSGDPVEDMVQLMRYRRSIDLRIEPHPFTVPSFTAANPIAKEIMETGIRIV
ncbi:MAG TPA: nucleotidyltransferase domain-containing protein [Spirochaetota bacterium]|nr:nucleotidyltransferase domain-containing protein [Spirochaetota bacterium]